MKIRSYLLILLPAFLLSTLSILGQSQNFKRPFHHFHQLNETHGLSNNVINDILQDQTGFIWVATEDGLFRYDGNEFIIFKNKLDDPNSLPNNSVHALYCDISNRIWALTDYGIGIYDSKKDEMTQILIGNLPHQLPHKSVTSITSKRGGAKYLGTFGGGVIEFKNNQFEKLRVEHNPDSIALDQQLVSQVYLDTDSILWIGTWNDGLLKMDLKYNKLEAVSFNSQSPLRIHTIYGKGNQLLIGSNHGLWFYDKKENIYQHFSKATHDWMPDDDVLSICEDDQEVIWVGTRNAGLISIKQRNLLDDRKLQIQHFKPSNHLTSISRRTISKIFQDHLGNLWLGTNNAGLHVFNVEGESVRLFTHLPDEPSINHPSVWGITEADDNQLWIGTDGGGLNLLNPYNQEVEQISTDDFNDQAILCALKSRAGLLWFGTYAGGINVYDPRTKKTTIYDTGNGMKKNDVRALFEMENGDIWIGTNGRGIHVFDHQTKVIHHLLETDYMDVRDMELGKDGKVYMATFGDGLVIYDLKTKNLAYQNWYSDGEYTPVAFTLHLEKNKVWLGTRQSGLVSFDLATKQFKAYTESMGLSNNTVRAIVPDRIGHLWVSTNLGLSCFSLEDNSIRNFDSSDGLQLGRFNDNSGIQLQNGDLVFGGIRGVNVFTPEKLLEKQMPPKVVFTNMKIFNAPNESQNSTTEIPIEPNTSQQLSYYGNTFAINFNALDFPNSQGWNYDYKLEGEDSDWNLNESIRSATYRNLSHGTYKFKIRSTNPSGTNKGEITSFQIEVLPPWWKTWAAYFIYTLLLGVLIFYIVRYNNHQIKLKQKLIYEQKLRQQEHSDIQQKLRFFTNFSHELRTPLTLIQGPVNDLLKMKSLQPHQSLLLLIKRNSSQLLKLVNRLLEFRKMETEETILNIDNYDLSILAEEEVEGFAYHARKNDIQLYLKVEKDLNCWCDIEKVQIILTNLLSNAVKYTPEGGEIIFSLKKRKEEIWLEVHDSGDGIPKEQLEAIFTPFFQAENSTGKGGTGIGLALTKSLVELHGGKITVVNEVQGTKFLVCLPTEKSNYESMPNVRFMQKVETISPLKEEEVPIISIANEKPILLVADDNQDILDYINEQLKDDYELHFAKDGKEALEKATLTLPDLIISDIMMPKMDGIEFCHNIKNTKTTNHIPVILLTAKVADEFKAEGYESGADSYITKPFSSSVLKARVNNLLNQRKQLRDLFATGEWEETTKIEDSPELQFIRHAEQTILELLEKTDITVPQLSKALGHSRTSLYRKIKSITGFSINQFIRVVKLKRAAHRLATEDVTTAEVAFNLGFTDPKYFRKCFKEQHGMLPSEYRKLNYSNDLSPSQVKDILNLKGKTN
jgi:signal transduction histidine kinase/ligand-binding sensor domain-containing protein/DNA-binding response OmpR family regulator